MNLRRFSIKLNDFIKKLKLVDPRPHQTIMDPVMNLATIILIENLGRTLARRFQLLQPVPPIIAMDIDNETVPVINYVAMDIDINPNDMDIT